MMNTATTFADKLLSQVYTQYQATQRNVPNTAYIPFNERWIACGQTPPPLESCEEFQCYVWLDSSPYSVTYKRFYVRNHDCPVWKSTTAHTEEDVYNLMKHHNIRISPISANSHFDDCHEEHHSHHFHQHHSDHLQPSVENMVTMSSEHHSHHVIGNNARNCNDWIEKFGKFITFFNSCGEAFCVSATDFISAVPNGLFIEEDGGLSLNQTEIFSANNTLFKNFLCQLIENDVQVKTSINNVIDLRIGMMVDGTTLKYENGVLSAVIQPIPLATATSVGGFKLKPDGILEIDSSGFLIVNAEKIPGITTGILQATGTTPQTVLVGNTVDIIGCALAVSLRGKSDLRITANAHPISVSASEPAYGVLRAIVDNVAVDSAHGSSYSFQVGSNAINQVPNATHLDTVITGVPAGNHLIKLTWTTLGPDCCAGGIILNQSLYDDQTDIVTAMNVGLIEIDNQALKCKLIIDVKASIL